MKEEKRVVDNIIDLESELFDDTCYLDEGQHTSLQKLYEVLDRELNDKEKKQVIEKRKEKMEDLTGEYIPEILNRGF